ncbi:MAG: hypothetical protein ABII71_05085 [Candidatus Micrarchaeota archaeon]
MAQTEGRRMRPETTLREEVQAAIDNIYEFVSVRIELQQFEPEEASRITSIARQAIHDAAHGYISAVEEAHEERIPPSRLETYLLGWATDIAGMYPQMDAREWAELPDGGRHLPERSAHPGSYTEASHILESAYTERNVSSYMREVIEHADQFAEVAVENALERGEVQSLIGSVVTEALGRLMERGGIDLNNSARLRLDLVREAREVIYELRTGALTPQDLGDMPLPDPETMEGRYAQSDAILGVVERNISSAFLANTRGGDFRAGVIAIMDEAVVVVGRHITDPLIEENVLGLIEDTIEQARSELSEVGTERVEIGNARSRLIDRAVELLTTRRDALIGIFERGGAAASRMRVDPEQFQIAINTLSQIRHGGADFRMARPRLR